ncbi:MAG: DUF1343 domain-containing protein [Myxococcota bacterium]
MIRTGLDVLMRDPALVRGRTLGLVAHPASVDGSLRHTRDLLASVATLKVLFGPEHGWGGAAQDMIGVTDEEVESERVVSLYGETAADLQPRIEDLKGLDAVVVDLQDVGARYYTYVWTAAFMLRTASKVGVPVIVLDRPNPLGGVVTEGRPQRPGYRSFVGLYEVPVRHGLTIGEILEMVRRRERIDEEALHVVPMEGWTRSMWFDDTGLPWVLPSPNMPTLDTATVYPGGCVIEGTTLSEGRGQTRPFEIWGAPWLDGGTLASVEVEGATLRPLVFEPTFQKHAKLACGGVQVHVTDRERFRSYAAYLRWLGAAIGSRPEGTAPWRTEIYEYDFRRPAIDLLTGGPEYRQLVNANASLDDYVREDEKGAAAFEEERRSLFRYD